MKLNRIEIVGLYGSFNANIKFDDKLNLLVGINGCGKTSVLNCIDWMLRPEFAKLASVPFERIQLDFTFRSRKYSLKASQNKDRLTISESSSGLHSHPIHIDFYRPPESIRTEAEFNHAYRYYKRLTPDPSERKLWKFLLELPHPLTVTLDRSISAETDDAVYLDSDVRVRSQSAVRAKTPIDKVGDVTRERYSVYRKQIYSLNEKLKTALVISAFRVPFQRPKAVKKISLSDISKLETKVTTLLATSLGLGTEISKITKYFTSAKSFAKEFSTDDNNMRAFFWTQYQQIDDFAEAFDEYERGASQAYESLGSYLAAINSFFVDSGKNIGFNDQDGSLAFRFLDKAGQPAGPFRSLEKLSSGERQVIILITFLAFVLEPNHIFVVDEPELSLHPKWQSNFLDAIISQAPDRTQILIATHSPEIAGRHRESCILLGI